MRYKSSLRQGNMRHLRKIFNRDYRERKIISLIDHHEWLLRTQWGKEKYLFHSICKDYYNAYGCFPDLKHPMNLNEKLLWLSYYWRSPLKGQCADKYKCREYVTKECGLPESLLVPLYGVWDNVDDIDFSSLPDSFVLKCNHGCGYNIIVKDKSNLDYEDAKQTLNKWMAGNYSGNASEIHYKDIHPHVIICEKFLSPRLGDNSQIDYKLFCINGEIMFVFVCYNRNNNGEALYATFSTEWKQLFYTKNEFPTHISLPKSLRQMILYAKSLSKPFPFVRIDFYEFDGTPLFGEMTFTPYGNIMTYFKDDVLMKYGQRLRLPRKIIW